MTDTRISKLLDDVRLLSATRHDVLQQVRGLILGMSAEMGEELKYGGILFSAGKPFCGLFAYTHHVSLEFSEGAKLPDPHKVLEGAGKQRRHIKLVEPADIAGKHAAHYLKLALQASKS